MQFKGSARRFPDPNQSLLMAEQRRPTSRFIAAMGVAFVLVLVAAILRAPSSNWDLALLGILLGLFGLQRPDGCRHRFQPQVIGGSFLALVVAMVFLGGPPAALIGDPHDPHRLAPLARRLALRCSTT